MIVGKNYLNKELNAYARLDEDGCLEYGFFDGNGECDDPFFRQKHLIVKGYHYEKGGDEYQELCEWIESLLRGEAVPSTEQGEV